jgi:hypothetical protein
MNAKQATVIALAVLAGAVARDLFVGRAGAEEDALRRQDVVQIVRALEAQASATKELVGATKDVGREVREAGRNCK